MEAFDNGFRTGPYRTTRSGTRYRTLSRPGRIRLAEFRDGPGVPNEGRVEVRPADSWTWGGVCGKHFDLRDADVVCRMLGYIWANDSFYTGRVLHGYMAALRCDGNESSLFDCSYAGWESHVCANRLYAGVVCGRVEVRPEDSMTWGTVCHNRFNMDDADVVCRMLGYPNATQVQNDAYFGQGTGPIYMDDVRCDGNETSLFSCSYTGWTIHDCDHGQDAGVVCRTGRVFLPQSGNREELWEKEMASTRSGANHRHRRSANSNCSCDRPHAQTDKMAAPFRHGCPEMFCSYVYYGLGANGISQQEQSNLQTQLEASSSTVNVRKTRTCKKCQQPMKGHPRGACPKHLYDHTWSTVRLYGIPTPSVVPRRWSESNEGRREWLTINEWNKLPGQLVKAQTVEAFKAGLLAAQPYQLIEENDLDDNPGATDCCSTKENYPVTPTTRSFDGQASNRAYLCRSIHVFAVPDERPGARAGRISHGSALFTMTSSLGICAFEWGYFHSDAVYDGEAQAH
ncbi:scavenger receptor [Branchiostoma belcheri]|nr:scavenger receptor [Branchiostoma belcheri]